MDENSIIPSLPLDMNNKMPSDLTFRVQPRDTVEMLPIDAAPHERETIECCSANRWIAKVGKSLSVACGNVLVETLRPRQV
jgi:hypothetical protein